MSPSMHELTVSMFCRGLESLKHLLEKGQASATERGFDPKVLLAARLYPNMFDLRQQVFAATDTARRGAQRIAGVELTSVTDEEDTFEALLGRVDTTVALLQEMDASLFEESATRKFVANLGQMEMPFEGRSFLLGFALPNFMFHLSMAHAILRHNGVAIGKVDFVRSFVAGATAGG